MTNVEIERLIESTWPALKGKVRPGGAIYMPAYHEAEIRRHMRRWDKGNWLGLWARPGFMAQSWECNDMVLDLIQHIRREHAKSRSRLPIFSVWAAVPGTRVTNHAYLGFVESGICRAMCVQTGKVCNLDRVNHVEAV
jgi:hypothetical protein